LPLQPTNKKYIALIIALAVLLCGCGAKNTAKPAGSAGASSLATTQARGETAKPSASPAKTAEASATPAKSAPATVKPSQGDKETTATPAGSALATASAAPTPSPTPTAPPKGTVVDGWVVGIPGYVPRFSCGSIDHSQSKIVEGSVSSVFSVCFKGVDKAGVDAYAAALTGKGFVVATAEIGTTYTLTASLDGDWDTATLVITLTETDGVAYYVLGVPV
jgi:hypothetical protein